MGGHWGVPHVALLDSSFSQSAKRGRIWTCSYVQGPFLEPLPLHPIWNMALACSISLTIHCSVMFLLIAVNFNDWNPQDWDHRHKNLLVLLLKSNSFFFYYLDEMEYCCPMLCSPLLHLGWKKKLLKMTDSITCIFKIVLTYPKLQQVFKGWTRYLLRSVPAQAALWFCDSKGTFYSALWPAGSL